ncbi:MAG: hypothetical protein ABGZ23_30925 [Fuerstiella sp.]
MSFNTNVALPKESSSPDSAEHAFDAFAHEDAESDTSSATVGIAAYVAMADAELRRRVDSAPDR